MTVRWKPLLILSGVFALFGLVGLLTMAYALAPQSSADHVKLARAERLNKKFDKAKIHYQGALQAEPRNPTTHEELAAMYTEWAATLTGSKAEELKSQAITELEESVKFDPKALSPRRLLLAAALDRDDTGDSLRFAREILPLEAGNVDAHLVLASEALEETNPALPEIRAHVKALDGAKLSPIRLTWLKASLAAAELDPTGTETILASYRTTKLPESASQIDRIYSLKLRALDMGRSKTAEELASRVTAFRGEAEELAKADDLPAGRLNRLADMLQTAEGTLKSLVTVAPSATAAANAVGKISESIYTRSIESGKASLSLYGTYAEHLRVSQKREECLKIVDQALKLPVATMVANQPEALRLRTIGVQAALGDNSDPRRIDRASGYINDLMNCKVANYQGIGHLFQGSIELEQIGKTGGDDAKPTVEGKQVVPTIKLQRSALGHLKKATDLLPNLAEAQARYGVALILSQETALGRQYLRKAQGLGTLEPQYQIWAAWSLVQAGYPEEAEPIVAKLAAEIETGKYSRELVGTLHLISAEIYQSHRTEVDFKKALNEYELAFKVGQERTPSVIRRMAQIEVMLGKSDEALARLTEIVKSGQDSPMTEHLAVLTLQQQGKTEEARVRLNAARTKYPESDALAGLHAAVLVSEDKAEEAEKQLAEFMVRVPENSSIAQLRATILSQKLDRVAEARTILSEIGDRSVTSAPLVQLALIDLEKRNLEAVSETIGKIRKRWPEAAAGDQLDAQLSLANGNATAAAAFFDAALKKDPTNKVVQFWKAELDGRMGATGEASKLFQSLSKDRPMKEIDDGLPLWTAAEAALARLDMAGGDFDAAITRYSAILRSTDTREAAHDIRWQLIAAMSGKGQWDQAKVEMTKLLADKKTPASAEDHVRAADYYRIHDEADAAIAELDVVLKEKPAHPAAVIGKATVLTRKKDAAGAIAVLRKGIELAKPPLAVFYLTLAAIENETPPNGLAKANASLDAGLKVVPAALELVQAKYRVLELGGDRAAGVEFVEAKSKEFPNGPFKRLLVELKRESGDFAGAEKLVEQIRTTEPKDARVAEMLVRLVAAQAVAASERNDRETEKAQNDRCALLIREFRAKFTQDLSFPQAECELAIRVGDSARAVTISQQMDVINKLSPIGPLIRAKIYSQQGRTRETIECYRDALARTPRVPEVRVLLGQALLRTGDFEAAGREAQQALDIERNRPDATLLMARVLSQNPATNTTSRNQAIQLLSDAVRRQPKVADYYHLLAEILLAQKRNEEAYRTLAAALKELPEDGTALSILIENLCKGGTPSDLAKASASAQAFSGNDKKGFLDLAVAVGYHKAGLFELALPWAEKSTAKLDKPVVHLNHGDLLLSLAETSKDSSAQREYLRRAVEQYDAVLKINANSIEAINNKAWILHTYLNQSQAALEVAMGLVKRANPASLPPEFFDTLGSIQESIGQVRQAEESYQNGLRKAPDHPMLNYHLGRMLAQDKNKAGKAGSYLAKAQSAGNRLTPDMVADIDALLRKVGH